MSIITTLKQKKSSLSQDSKSVLTLVGGTTVAQALNFLFSPITTRLFRPEVFGDLSVFTSLISIVGVIICLRYELAIILPKDDNEGFALLRLCFIFTTIISAITGFIFLINNKEIYLKFGAKNLIAYWCYVPISLFLTGIIQASNYWLTRTRQFTVLSWNKVIPVLIVNIVSIVLGLAGNTGIGARLFAVLISNVVNIAVIAGAIIPEFKSNKYTEKINYNRLIRRYKNFLIYDIWGALLNNLSWMIVPILMNAYYGSNAAGQYSIGMRVIQIPASLIGASITQVFLRNASERRYNRTLYKYCIETTKKLLKYTAPVVIILLILGKPVFHFVFGNKWDLAGVYTQILAPWALLWFCASPMHSVFTITQKQNVYLIFSIVNLATRFLSLYLGKVLNSDVWGIVFFSISGFIVYGVSLILALREAKKSDMAPTRP
ncbi:MAG TPA: hypothetical protein DHU26_05225 [Spirochaetaceae bacterium]|nr:hypothetical protein [Spirochaetaceae bacterium]